MGNMLGYGMTLNTGNYFGSGYSAAGTYGSSSSNRVASSTNLNRIARDLASGYSDDMEHVQFYLSKGKIEKAMSIYDSMLADAKATANEYGYSLSDGQIETALSNAFRAATGSSYAVAIEENAHSPFVTGLLEGLPVIGLFTDGTSNSEAMAKISGIESPKEDKWLEAAGAGITTGLTLVGAALCPNPITIGLAAVTVINSLSKMKK